MEKGQLNIDQPLSLTFHKKTAIFWLNDKGGYVAVAAKILSWRQICYISFISLWCWLRMATIRLLPLKTTMAASEKRMLMVDVVQMSYIFLRVKPIVAIWSILLEYVAGKSKYDFRTINDSITKVYYLSQNDAGTYV